MINKKETSFSQEINTLIHNYYEDYYKSSLGLPNWKDLCQQRINEEEIYCSRYIDNIKNWINIDFSKKNVLVVGSGTGGELVNFFLEGADVYGIEPYEPANEISRLKAKSIGFPETNIKSGSAEDIDFEDRFFDFVYCYTVIEHVEDVAQSIKEMLRVVKPGGHLFIQAPDYRQLYEGHYKLPLPMFLPIWFNKILLRIYGRPVDFLNTINKVNSKGIKNILDSHKILSMQIHPNREKRLSNRYIVKIIFFIQDLIYKRFNAPLNQIWLIKKNN